ncbi:hypothetical protein VNI00_013269 [Paramarasmius palmivorus]|uniref:Uncharacterized protein n=1 Tax=Paramarasmius palmivorus TaxID=297713 RepID=A0AAW0C1U4_9AGAR
MDPVETVAHLDNFELTAACEKMSVQSYVGWVYSASGIFREELPYHYYTFRLLHQGLRPEGEKPGMSPEMSVPVLPNTKHPLGRKPLDPGRPLPWDNCYISPYFLVGGRCPTILLPDDPPNLYETSIKETVRVTRMINEDMHHCNERIVEMGTKEAGAAVASEETHQERHTEERISVDKLPTEPAQRRSSVDGTVPTVIEAEKDEVIGSTGPTVYSHRDTDSSPPVDAQKAHEPDELPDAVSNKSLNGGPIPLPAPSSPVGQLPTADGRDVGPEYASSGSGIVDLDPLYLDEVVIKVTYDLTSVDQVNDPADFFKELSALRKELEIDRRKREIADARAADEAFFAKLSEKRKDQDTPNVAGSEPEPEPELEPSTEPTAGPDPEPEAEQKSKPSAASRITQRLRLEGLRRKRAPHESAEDDPTANAAKSEPRPNIVFRVIRRAREGSASALQKAKQSTGALRRTFCF